RQCGRSTTSIPRIEVKGEAPEPRSAAACMAQPEPGSASAGALYLCRKLGVRSAARELHRRMVDCSRRANHERAIDDCLCLGGLLDLCLRANKLSRPSRSRKEL